MEVFSEIVTDQDSLTIPAQKDKSYYVSVGVNWGDEDKNVTVMYYFRINVVADES